MQTIQTGAQGLGLLMNMNWDRLLFVGAIAFALIAASQLGHFALPAGY
ncbi:MAG: hypothetical protein AAF762_09850 [Pseudomonadota bacterium]